MDYGLDCASVGWYAIDDIGIAYGYKELHRSNLIVSELAELIHEMTSPLERDALAYTVIPPDFFNKRNHETGKTGRQLLIENGMRGYGMKQADTRRVEGWRLCKEYLKPIADPYADKDETSKKTARILFLKGHMPNLCSHLPLLQHADNDPNDVALNPHDITHAPDQFRYFAMSRPPLRSITVKERQKSRKKHEKLMEPIYQKCGY